MINYGLNINLFSRDIEIDFTYLFMTNPMVYFKFDFTNTK